MPDFPPAAESTRRASRATGWVWAFLPILAGVLLLQPNYDWDAGRPRQNPYGSDFLQEYVGGRIVLGGQSHRLYDGELSRTLQADAEFLGYEPTGPGYYPMVYPPFWYAAVAPLSIVPLRWAAPVWLVVLGGAWVAVLRWASAGDARTGRALRRSAPVLLLAGPLLLSLAMGQKSILLTASLLMCVLLIERGRLSAAGVALGLISFKPHLMLLLAGPLVLRYRWRFLRGLLAAAAAATAIGFLVSGEAMAGYAVFIGRSLDGSYSGHAGYRLIETHNWAGLWERAMGPGAMSRQATLLWSVATLVFVSMVAVTNRGRPLSPTGWTAVVLSAVLVSPHFYSYDLLLLAVPAVLLVRQIDGQPRRAVLRGMAGLLTLTLLPRVSGYFPTFSLQWSTLFLATAFFVCCVRELRRPRDESITLAASRRVPAG